jgi:hypothetical protein
VLNDSRLAPPVVRRPAESNNCRQSEARGIRLRISDERNIALVNSAERHVETMLEQLVKPAKSDENDFEDVTAVYGTLTSDSVPTSDISGVVGPELPAHQANLRVARMVQQDQGSVYRALISCLIQ